MSARDASWQPAWLLHARPWQETSVLAEWLLPAQGRIGGIVRGARRQGGTIPSPFQPYFIQLAGQGELRRVAALEPAGPTQTLTGPALFSGLYLNELLVRLLPRDLPQPELFVAYAGAIGALSETDPLDTAGIEAVLRRFERQLLDAMGQSVSDGHEAGSHVPLRADAHYQYHPGEGWLPAREGQRGACRGEDILAVAQDDFSTPDRRRLAKLLYRAALEPLLGTRPLKSRDLFLAMAPRPRTDPATDAPSPPEES